MLLADRRRPGGRIVSAVTRRRAVDPFVVFGIALVARLGLVAGSRGGPFGIVGYDPAVYYAAADALTHGRLPYIDFVLLHPPGLMLVLTPFAALGRLTTDPIGFAVANAAFSVLGAVNAVLVMRVARALQLSRSAALLGGLFYAIWWSAISAEFTVRLEPLGNFAFLCGILALAKADLAASGRRRDRLLVAAGAALGVTVSTKIWWIAPVLAVLGWRLAVRRRGGDTARILVGVALASVLIDGVFFVAAPGAMWRMVVLDQLARHPMRASRFVRFGQLSSIHAAMPTASRPAVLATVAAVVALLLFAAAWRVGNCRVLVLVAASQVAVLIAAPVYFTYYSGYPAASLALVVAAAAHGRRSPSMSSRASPYDRAGGFLATATVAAVAMLTGLAMQLHVKHVVTPFPGRQLASGVVETRCVMADSPMALIELDVLSRDLANNCPNWVDVTGRTYDVDAAPPTNWVPRLRNSRWQQDLRRYLLSGDAVIVIRPSDGMTPSTLDAVTDQPVLESDDGYVVYRVQGLHHVE